MRDRAGEAQNSRDERDLGTYPTGKYWDHRGHNIRLHDYLNFHAREHPDDEFAIDIVRQLTYAEAAAEANQLANVFVAAGSDGPQIASMVRRLW